MRPLYSHVQVRCAISQSIYRAATGMHGSRGHRAAATAAAADAPAATALLLFAHAMHCTSASPPPGAAKSWHQATSLLSQLPTLRLWPPPPKPAGSSAPRSTRRVAPAPVVASAVTGLTTVATASAMASPPQLKITAAPLAPQKFKKLGAIVIMSEPQREFQPEQQAACAFASPARTACNTQQGSTMSTAPAAPVTPPKPTAREGGALRRSVRLAASRRSVSLPAIAVGRRQKRQNRALDSIKQPSLASVQRKRHCKGRFSATNARRDYHPQAVQGDVFQPIVAVDMKVAPFKPLQEEPLKGSLEHHSGPPFELMAPAMQRLVAIAIKGSGSTTANGNLTLLQSHNPAVALLALALALARASLSRRSCTPLPLPAAHPLVTLAQLALHVPLLRLCRSNAAGTAQLPLQQMHLQLAATPLPGVAAVAAAAALQLCCLARRIGSVGCSPQQLPEWATAAAAAALGPLFPHFAASHTLFAGGSLAAVAPVECVQAVHSVLTSTVDACRSLSAVTACLDSIPAPSPADEDALTSSRTILAFGCIAAIHACHLLHVLYREPRSHTRPTSYVHGRRCSRLPAASCSHLPQASHPSMPGCQREADRFFGLTFRVFANLLEVLGVCFSFMHVTALTNTQLSSQKRFLSRCRHRHSSAQRNRNFSIFML
jgi:hypothetical protein